MTDENLQEGLLPLPMPLVVSTVHHYLVKNKLRSRVSLICLSGNLVEDHHVAVLIGLGASAVYPYMAYELIREHFSDDDQWTGKMGNYRYALEKGLLKIMAKMGISTISSYHGSMLFHAVGLSGGFLKKHFPSIQGNIGGIDLDHIIKVQKNRHYAAFENKQPELVERGFFRFRKGGESRGFSPEGFKTIQKAANNKIKKNVETSDVVYIRDFFNILVSAILYLLN